MIDYSKQSEETFQAHAQALYAEQDRRAKLGSIPGEVKKLSNDFEAIGGDKEDLITKINEPVQDNSDSVELEQETNS